MFDNAETNFIIPESDNMSYKEHDRTAPVNMSPFQQYIAISKYARYLPEQKRRETWKETVTRYCDFFAKRSVDFPYDSIHQAILNLEVMPSMRAMMTAGPALDRDNVAGFNCCFCPIDDQRAFDEIMYILMTGCGVGFSVERQLIKKLPEIADTFNPTDTIIKVRDSRIGWASAYRELISLLYSGIIPKWDVDLLRPVGAPLKTFGGRSSGPGPLEDLFKFTINVFKNAVGRRLNSLECHDLVCKIGDIVVSGGVRRSALISLSNLSDDRLRVAKSGQWWNTDPQRALSNNSVAYTEKPDMQRFIQEWLSLYESKSGERGIFNRVASIAKAKTNGRRKVENNKKEIYEFGVNPCVTDDTWVATPEGLRQVKQLIGKWKSNDPLTHEYLVNNVSVKGSPFFYTGTKKVYKLITNEGFVIKLTKDHKVLVEGEKNKKVWKPAKVLQAGDKIIINSHKDLKQEREISIEEHEGYTIGCFIGDGTFAENQARIDFHGNKRECLQKIEAYVEEIGESCQRMHTQAGLIAVNAKVSNISDNITQISSTWLANKLKEYNIVKGNKTITPELMQAPLSVLRGVIAGLFDTDGSIFGDPSKNGLAVRISQSDSKMLKNLQICLSRFGIKATFYKRKDSGQNLLPDSNRNLKLYDTKASYELHIGRDSLWRFYDMFDICNPTHTEKFEFAKKQLKRIPYATHFAATFKSLKYIGKKKVYDVCVPGPNAFSANGLYVHNCGEISLRPNEFCNLSESVIRPTDTLQELLKKVELATIIGTFQATLTNFRYIRNVWKFNTDEEALLGVSLTGIMDHPVLSFPTEKARNWLRVLKAKAIETNQIWAEKLGINTSAAITTVKPSGTVSLLVDSSSGIHGRLSRTIIRTVRNDKKDPLSDFMIKSGVPHETDVMKDSNWVFSFPVRAPDCCRLADDMTAIEQLEHYLMFYEEWAEHNVSVTIYVREHEWLEVAAWVYKHFDRINGISFLPYSDHIYQQAPIQPISEEAYIKAKTEFPDLDFAQYKVSEHEDFANAAKNLACSAGVCELT